MGLILRRSGRPPEGGHWGWFCQMRKEKRVQEEVLQPDREADTGRPRMQRRGTPVDKQAGVGAR